MCHHRQRIGNGFTSKDDSGNGHDLHGCPSCYTADSLRGAREPGPSRMYALQARKHVTALRRAKQDITIEIRRCPAHKGVPGNERADEWAKLAAEKPDARVMPLPRSLAHLKREISEKKRSGWKHGIGLEAGSPRRNTERQRSRGWMVWWRGVLRGWPQDSIR